MERLARANADFSLSLYGRLAAQHPDLIFSPHSVHTALTMTYLGARAKTAKQMLRVLQLNRLRKQKAHMAYHALTTSLTANLAGNVTLNVANAVYVKPGFAVEEAFRTGLRTMYQAEFDRFDFTAEGGPEAPINSWVTNRTAGKIQDFLSAGTVTPLTAMIIVNAIYFKGGWKEEFDAEATTEQTFYQDGGSTVPVQMMTRTGTYNYTNSDALQSHVLELRYQGDRFSMFIVLPTTRNGLGQVESALTYQALTTALQAAREVRVRLFLPRFESETKVSLKQTLIAMGMRDPFNPNKAKFQGISSDPQQELHISDVIHQAVVEVTEEGTEAAAATGVILGLRSFPGPRTVEVRADHPFLYLIRDNLSGTILFMGKYSAQQ